MQVGEPQDRTCLAGYGCTLSLLLYGVMLLTSGTVSLFNRS